MDNRSDQPLNTLLGKAASKAGDMTINQALNNALYTPSQLSYCSNVHPGESLPEVIDNIKQHFSAVREHRQLANMASGLWLSAKAAQTLIANDKALLAFNALIQQQGMLLTSLNGFPYGNFHQTVVKHNVYFPTWADEDRLRYTEQLATILSACLPAEQSCGVISTVPLAYAENWTETEQQQAINQLIQLSHYLQALEQSSGKRIVVCLEMEPDCVLESSDQLVHFFQEQLLPVAKAQNVDAKVILRYIGCCFDTCHQAVMAENINEVLTNIHSAGIYIGKIQISNAISATLNSNEAIDKLCTLFADAKFLHQTKVFCERTLLAALPDLCAKRLKTLLASTTKTLAHNNAQKQAKESTPRLTANIHYHVPIHQHEFELAFLSSSQTAIVSTLDFLNKHPACRPAIEIETYTWLNFLHSDAGKIDHLHQGLLAEFTWLETQLVNNALLNKSLLATADRDPNASTFNRT